MKSGILWELILWGVCLTVTVPGTSVAQEPEPTPTPTQLLTTPEPEVIVFDDAADDAAGPADDPEVRLAQPSIGETDLAPNRVRLTEPPPGPTHVSADGGTLKGCRAISIESGQVRVLLSDGSERLLRVGDAIGSDVVRRIEPGRMLLDRTAPSGGPGGSATVIVKFDATGDSRVHVLWMSDPKAVVAPEVE